MTYQSSEKKAVENPVVKYAVGLGVKVIKVNPLWSAGWNDRIFFVPGGRPLIIEFKREGGKTSKLQEERHAYLLKNGYDHHVIDNKEEGKALVRARLEAYRLHEKGDAVDSGASRVRPVSRSRAAKD